MIKEKNFREYFDENGCFCRESRLYFGQCTGNNKMSLQEILLFTSDTAVEDYYLRGLSWGFLYERGFVIMLARLSLAIERLPSANEEILLRTWEEAPQGLQLTRSYHMTTAEGETLLRGHSTWLVVNPETRRIIKPDLFTIRPVPTYYESFPGIPCGKITPPDNATLVEERRIGWSEMDGNRHMNNSRYGAYASDCLPEKWREETPKNIRFNFSKEAVLGEKVQLYCSEIEEKKQVIITIKQDNVTCFEAEFSY